VIGIPVKAGAFAEVHVKFVAAQARIEYYYVLTSTKSTYFPMTTDG
jgi:hypothetical protein